MADMKKRQEKIFPEGAKLSKYLYIIMIFGLVVAIILMVAGFLVNISGDFTPSVVKDFEVNTIGPEKLTKILDDISVSWVILLEYAGIFFLILVPVAGLLCATVFFAQNKKYQLMLIALGVLLILAVSAVRGFMM